MKRKTIEEIREARMWIKDIIVPTVGIVAFLVMNKDRMDGVRAVLDRIHSRKAGRP